MRILFIDGFKPSYLEYAPYLRSLTEHYQHGHVITPLGYWGAMETFYKGRSDTLAFYCRNKKSSLWWTKYCSFIGNLLLSIAVNTVRLVKNQRPFFRICRNLPLNKLHLFDTAIKRSLTEGLSHKITAFHGLDGIGHRYGPQSLEIRTAVKELDNKIKNIKFDILISDHGMGAVTKRITVPETDICFLDATMARYWDRKPDIPKKYGRWISGSEEFGRYIFLTNPGVLIAPNYWSSGEEKGMHGWDPEHSDMHAFYLLKQPGSCVNKRMKELNAYLKG